MHRHLHLLVLALAAVAGVLAVTEGSGQGAAPAYKLTQIGRFDGPVHVTAPPADTRRVFVVEKPGRIRVVLDGRVLKRPFLDLSALIPNAGNETGLLSLAFAPEYAQTGLFYIYYTDLDDFPVLAEYRRSKTNPNVADPSTRRQVLRFAPPSGEHYGGHLLFGPERRLYLSVGDGGLNRFRDPMRAQRLNDIHGKIASVNRRTGATRVIARGLRNPWRFWFDSGDLYVGDAGEYVRESIDYVPAARVQGANFGWPCFEGTLAKPDYPAKDCPGALGPLYEWARQYGNCAAIGGLVSHDPRLPALRGRYLFADFCLGEVLALDAKSKHGERGPFRLGLRRPTLTSFGIDARRRIYLTTLNGPVYRLDPR